MDDARQEPALPTRPMIRLRHILMALALTVAGRPLYAADPAPFELAGPTLRIIVTRGERTLPIGEVPSLAEGDRLSIAAQLPPDQGARFILVSAFLRGATNPPPKDWIAFAETWAKKDRKRSLELAVPKGARQMVLFLVPDTGGAEGSLQDAVRGKPGEFVRATQDLNQASLDRSRLDAFMGAIKAQENSHPEFLRTLAPPLARSLSMKLNEECLSRVIEMQAACLLDNRDSLVLADVHTSSMAETLTGAPTDLALQLSATREAGYGYYSPYIAVVRDVAKIFGAFSNPSFDYLPTLTVRKGPDMALLLNSAPSFAKPKSVMVVAMPSIEADSPPRLRSGAGGPICLARAGGLLPVEGAPLIYSTGYARDMMLTVKASSGESIEVPVVARADRGGYVLGPQEWPTSFQGTMDGHLHGLWGFDRFEGPDFTVQLPDAQGWRIEGDAAALVVGRDNGLTLKGGAPACVESVTLRQGKDAPMGVAYKVAGRDALTLTLPLADRKPGTLSIEVRYAGMAEPSVLTLRSYAQASRLDALQLHAGDRSAVLSGQRLDEVQGVEAAGLTMRPDGLTREGSVDRLRLLADGEGGALQEGQEGVARVKLRDGRTVSLPFDVGAPRPQLALLSKSITPPAVTGGIVPDLSGDDLLPDQGRIIFSVKAQGATRFAASDSLEVTGAEDGAPVIRLTMGDPVRLEGPQVMVATLDPKAAAPNLFGPLRFRLRQGEVASDWQPLVTLARLPRIESVACDGGQGCTLRGRDLFLIDAVGATPTLDGAAQVAHGYTGATLRTPPPQGGKLYLRLRDAPGHVLSIPAA
nr:hypothetical protein [Sphingobium amiense]